MDILLIPALIALLYHLIKRPPIVLYPATVVYVALIILFFPVFIGYWLLKRGVKKSEPPSINKEP